MQPDLPEDYYLTNLIKLIDFVHDTYSDILSPAENNFYHDFHALNRASQLLYGRLITRRGPYIRSDKLIYSEIPDIPKAIVSLADAKFIQHQPKIPTRDQLNLLIKKELESLFYSNPKILNARKVKQLRKDELIESILLQYSESEIQQKVLTLFDIVEPMHSEILQIFRLCFFGNLLQDFSDFILVDLGRVKYESYSIQPKDRYFGNREILELRAQYFNLTLLLEEDIRSLNKEELLLFYQSIPTPQNHHELKSRYNKLAFAIARQLERLNCNEEAIAIYTIIDNFKSKERLIRILEKQQQYEEALCLCLENPENDINQTTDEEKQFLELFIPKLQKKLSLPVTKLPTYKPTIGEIVIPRVPNESVELSAANHFNALGSQCFYVENRLFNGLFGLFFWDLIFESHPGAFCNYFQRGPNGLFKQDFWHAREKAFASRLDELSNDGNWQNVIKMRYTEKQGIANYLVNWQALSLDVLQLALSTIPAKDLKAIFLRLSHNLQSNRSGLPDLIEFSNNKQYQLIEIKGPGDTIQKNQLRWFRFFEEANIPASVINVRWAEESTL